MAEQEDCESRTDKASSGKRRRILVVDTRPGCWGLYHALATKGPEIVAVSSAAEAVQNIVDGPFAGALIDADLEGPIDGILYVRKPRFICDVVDLLKALGAVS